MKKLAWAAALALPVVVSSPARSEEPAPRPTVRTLPNGLRIVAREAKGTGLVALVCYVDGGNRTEPPELSGLSHYYEHLVFRGGTARQAELETRKVFTQLGTFYGFTTEDATCFYFIAPLASLDEALWRHKDAVTKVLVTDEKVAKEREVVLSEYKISVTDSPAGSLWHDLYTKAFEKHPYGRTTIGLREVIEKCDLARFKSFYQERYVSNHMVISVVGDLPEERLVEKVQAQWSDLARGKESFELDAREPAQKAFKLTEESRDALTQCHLGLAFHATSALDPARIVHDVLAQVLSGGESARLPRALTERRIALGAGAYSPSSVDPGLFVLAISAEPEKEALALEEAVSVLRGVARHGISEEELANAKRRLATETILGGEALKDEALRYAYWSIARDPDVGATYLEKARAVTAAQVQAAAAELFRPENATLGVVRPKGRAAPDWARIVGDLAAEQPRGAKLIQHPSGARIVLEEEGRHPTVAFELRVRGGALAEGAGEAGLAALVERCLTRGTKRLDRAAFALEWDRLAIRLGTGSDREGISLSLRATVETFEPALALLGEALREPAFSPDEVKKAREEQLESIRSVEDDSYSLTNERYALALYGADHPYGRPLQGTRASVERFSREDLVRFHERVFKPENMVAAVVGAIDPVRALALVEKTLGISSQSPARSPATLEPPARVEPRPGVTLLDRKREQATLDLGLVTVAASDPDYLPLQVAARHLGNELFFRYVYEQGIAYRMWTRLSPGLGARPLTLEMGVTPSNFAKARQGLEDAVAGLVAKGLTADELARAKQDLVNRYLLARETGADRARSLAGYEALGLGWDWEDRLPKALDAVTVESVRAAVARRVDASKLTLVVTGDKSALEAAGVHLEAEAPQTKREPD